VETGRLVVRDGAEVTGSSTGSEIAGNLQLKARSIQLDNLGAITATTSSGNGGDITLQVQDLLLMRQNSNISTTAGITGAGGDGGNIDINAPFIVAVPEENSDITANAFSGSGGNIQITASGIFGTQFRDRLTPESDITASSEFGAAGVVTLNTPDVDPSQGLVGLPAELVDASGLIASGCGAGGRQGESKFIVTGRGGLPLSPGDATLSPYPTGTVRSIPSTAPSSDSHDHSVSGSDPFTKPTTPAPTQIVEAQGWMINALGSVVLTASAPTATPYIPWLTQASCHTPETSS
jgi:large exoprotein involved in heme utilization and adhesion